MIRAISTLVVITLVASRPPQTPVFSTRVEMVRVDVLATRNGEPVMGLRPEDFEVRDNGVLQQVTFVSLEEMPLDDVADACGCSLATAKRRIARADAGLEARRREGRA